MKKIIFITKALWIGGIETALVNLLNQFDYKKYDVTLLVLHGELDMLEQINPNCRVLIVDRDQTYTFKKVYRYSRLYHLTERTDHPSSLHKKMMWTIPMVRWIENRLYIHYVRKFMKNEKFDTAIIYSDVVAEIAIRTIKADKFLMFYHHGGMRHVYHDKIAYKKCKKIIAVSQNQADKLKKFVPRYAEKIIAIPNLIDVNKIRNKGQLTCDDVFDAKKFNIVSVGRISYEKGMDLAVYACEKLVAHGFRNIQWWIVGNGPEMQKLKKTILKLHMEEYVKLVGMKNNPYPYIRQADLYVQPSRVESFGLTIAEALILGKPVLATNTDGACEILKNGQNGSLCNIGSKELFEKCREILLNKTLFNKVSKKIEIYEVENRRKLRKLETLL